MQTHRTFKPLLSVAQGIFTLLCAAFWQTSAAQVAEAPQAEGAANPSAKVPAVDYRSVFKETTLGLEKGSTDWRKANDEVGKFTRGHIDILKWEEQEAAKAMKAQADKPMANPAMPKTTAATPAPATSGSTPAGSNAAKPMAAPAHKH